MNRAALACWVLLSSTSPACGRAPSWPPSPATLRAGEDVCAGCRMFVSDLRFAVQLHSRTGAVEWFDDLGCLLSAHEQGVEPESVFVRAFQAEAWVRGDRGVAVRVPGLDSPMGSGWTVQASAAAAPAPDRPDGARHVALSELLLRGPSAASQL